MFDKNSEKEEAKGKEKATRKIASEIIDEIFEVLSDKKIHTISDIASNTKSHWKTIRNQIDIILKVQEKPKIELLKASKQTLVRII